MHEFEAGAAIGFVAGAAIGFLAGCGVANVIWFACALAKQAKKEKRDGN